jgi:hypothetical protein
MSFPVFASGDILNASDMNGVGLWLVKTQTIGNAVSSVTVTGAFSSDYDNYLVTITGGVASTDANIQFRLGASATAYSGSLIYSSYTIATVSLAQDNNNTQFSFAGSGNTNGLNFNGTVLGPNLAKWTTISTSYLGALSGGNYNGIHKATTQHTAFTIIAGAGTWTGGSIRVYGMRNSL